MTISYGTESPRDADVEEIARVYRESGLAERRPVEDTERFTAMIRGAGLLLVAREDGRAVGVARCLTDDSYVTYVSDIAVSASHQRTGVGKALLDEIERQVPGVKLVLLSAPDAREYYPKVGFDQHPSAWTRQPAEEWKRG
ncbi:MULTISPECIES: GNAT family N-acetyltransferase [unclassified Streptomyces]|uniref:GNAT family N-acetyltransferase n=1 Tax=unclassified Streptomyces TaxID=2593676 RepID=UPI002E2C204D|nr:MULTISPECIES: GNAT family N-acetyltransferase [unclassified Streptomyces]WUB87077.1 GNAT family N-acetyltransferase [Streptomyces sp. NBC_00566]